MRRGLGPLSLTALAFGYAFLYGPIAVLIVYSFNDSRLVAVWGGFSTRWYAALLDNDRILDAAWLSLRIAAANATVAVALGTVAAFALVRWRRFRGKAVLGGLLTAPLVMPEIILGLSMLLLFVWLEGWSGWPEGRGGLTITIAHITMSLAYATVVIRARLVRLDRDVEDAAADLGAPPHRVLLQVTLPMLGPALVAAWLLAFTLSLDDLVIASFVSGPGSSTLPIVIFSSVRLGVSPQVNALAALIVVAVAAIAVIAGWLFQRQARAGTSP
jgi:putrescine transport system permease protein